MKRQTKPPHQPTQAQRQLVQLHATIGTDQATIARIVGIDAKTLRKHYREELDLAFAQANATIGGALFNKAKSGDTASMIFWLKTRAGWRETSRHELTGADGGPIRSEQAVDLSKLSPAALAELDAALGPDTDD